MLAEAEEGLNFLSGEVTELSELKFFYTNASDSYAHKAFYSDAMTFKDTADFPVFSFHKYYSHAVGIKFLRIKKHHLHEDRA